MKHWDSEAYIAEEAFIIGQSGEIPEVALHGSIFYLTEDPEGPGFNLAAEDMAPLKQAVVARYRQNIRRDLDPENRDAGMYRGLARCAVNWQRLCKFCFREKIDIAAIRSETAAGLRRFLERETADIAGGRRNSCVNCSSQEIESLAKSLGLRPADLPAGWQELCP